jgi:hypothetical protein
VDRRRIAVVLLAGGCVLVAVSALADEIGVGEGSGVGWKQVVGMVVGVAAIAVGALWWRSGAGAPEAGSPEH